MIHNAASVATRRASRARSAQRAKKRQRKVESSQRQSRPALLSRQHLESYGLAAATLAGISIAEYVTAFISPPVGIGIHVILLTVFLTGGAVAQGERRAFLLMLAVAPLIRIVSLGMPLSKVPQPFWYVLTAVPILAAGGMIAANLDIKPRLLGLRLPPRGFVWMECVVAVSGIGLGVIEWRILDVRPLVNGNSVGWIVAGAGILLIFTGFFEEFIFRGLIQRIAGNFLGIWPGIGFTALIFAALHIGWHSIFDLLFVMLVAIYFSLIVRATGSLLGVTFAHGAINIMLFITMPLLMVPSSLNFSLSHQTAPQLHTQGAAGLVSGSTVRLHWRSSPVAEKYQVQVVATSARRFNKRDWTGPGVIRTVTSNHMPLRVIGPLRYFWRVRTALWGSWLPYSRTRHFKVLPPSTRPPRGLVLTFGPRTTNGVQTKLCWNRAPGAGAYRLRGSSTGYKRTSARCITRTLPPGQYSWSVASIGIGATSYTSRYAHPVLFWVGRKGEGIYRKQTTATTLSVPTNLTVSKLGATSTGIKLRLCWSAVAAAVKYKVKVLPSGSAKTKNTCLNEAFQDGIHKWKVIPIASGPKRATGIHSKPVYFWTHGPTFGIYVSKRPQPGPLSSQS